MNQRWHQTMLNKLFINLSLFSLVMLGQHAMALPEDSQLPINIESDRASQKALKNGEKTEYFGNVLMTQGSVKISGDHIIVHSKDSKVSSIRALGKPAQFEQQSDPNKAPIKANANRLDYQLNQDIVILSDNASIQQNDTTVSGKKIEYNIATEQVKASSGKEKSSRVKMVLIPEASDKIDHSDSNTQ